MSQSKEEKARLMPAPPGGPSPRIRRDAEQQQQQQQHQKQQQQQLHQLLLGIGVLLGLVVSAYFLPSWMMLFVAPLFVGVSLHFVLNSMP